MARMAIVALLGVGYLAARLAMRPKSMRKWIIVETVLVVAGVGIAPLLQWLARTYPP